MSKGKRDALILTLIGLILYGLVYYNFVLVDAMAEFESINTKIENAEKKKAALDEDLINLPTLERNLEIKKVQDERLEEYLMSASNISDNIEYIDKLAKHFDNKITEITVGVPKKNVSKETQTEYYEFGIDFSASMAYSKAMNLINYIEGGTRKVKIVLFHMTPVGSTIQNEQMPPNAIPNADDEFVIQMQVNLFSLNLSDINKVNEYSRKRFNTYGEGDGVIFVPESNTVSTNDNGSGSTRRPSTGSSGPIREVVENGKHIDIQLRSFLLARQNFIIKAVGNQYPIKLKPKNKTEVKITFSGNDYHLSVLDDLGNNYDLRGLINSDRVNMYVAADFNLDIPENRNLSTDIQIINNSGKRVDLNLTDKVNRVNIKDRNGNLIVSRSDIEKVYIV